MKLEERYHIIAYMHCIHLHQILIIGLFSSCDLATDMWISVLLNEIEPLYHEQ